MTEKIGLVLEGGGMRGIFTAGVLDFFLEKSIAFDYCIGVSAGACHACSFLAGQHRRAFDVSVDYLRDRRYCSLYSLLTTGDLFGARMLYETIPNELYPVDNDFFLRGHTGFHAVITNCVTGEAEYPQIRDLRRDIGFVRASSSLPFVSNMVMLSGTPYLDGGISDSIPVAQAMDAGCTKVVAILTQPKEYRKKPAKLHPILLHRYKKYPHLIRQMKTRHARYNDTLEFLYHQEEKGNVFVIQPQRPIGLRRVEKSRQKLLAAYELGYAEAMERFQPLAEYLR